MNPSLKETMFREYDVRGLYPDEIGPETIRVVARGFAGFLRRRGITDVVLGYDSRRYSAKLHDATLQGLMESGCRVVDVGITLSPVLYFAQHLLAIKGGVMITASHNPDGWSGLKLCHGLSRTLEAHEIRELRDICIEGKFPSGQGTCIYRDVRQDYIETLCSKVKLPPQRPPKVVIDAANGTASLFAPELFRRAGCKVVATYCDLDTTFPHHFPNPSDLAARRALAAAVRQNRAIAGLSFDGDGDRLGVLDEKGRNVWSDLVLALLAEDVIARRANPAEAKIVFDVKCSAALPEHVRALGGTPIMWKTGHSNIKAKCHAETASLGGERSGHIFMCDGYYGFDDALFAGLKLVERLARGTRPLSKTIASLPRYLTSPEIQADCADEVKYEVVAKLVDEFRAAYGNEAVNDLSGARVSIRSGWGLVRASSNLPKLVMVFEAKTAEDLEAIKAEFRARLSRHSEVSAHWENE